ncbi:SPOR domain-containing protein [Peteryoungia desertarenae]|uniref:SPOR domain-containing protein n=1 Tax=Peteryoungia desertarenae TaxID=1813451 RepID=A0ABX6QP83_9HYPH|nr:SPOR domain-containing protein [Peteryoungia desertarenae]QLF70289.1 SPOR domain-containing protein [Peteryoungia desertarenae]
MVQKQAAYSSRAQGESFADDDPLAELARIVGFDQPQQRAPEPEREELPAAAPQEAEFNLEDELLREFSDYNPPVTVTPPVSRVAAEPQRAPEPARIEPDYREFSGIDDEPFDMGLSVADAYDQPEAQSARPADQDAPAFDLADELEFAVGEPEMPAEQPFDNSFANYKVAEPEAELPRPVQAPEQRLHLPLANFSVQPPRRIDHVVEPQPAAEIAPISAMELTPSSAPKAPEALVEKSLPQPGSSGEAFDPFARVSPAPVLSAPVDIELPSVASARQAAVAAPAEPFDFAAFTAERAQARAAEPLVAPVSSSRQEPDFGFSFDDEFGAEPEYRQPGRELETRQASTVVADDRSAEGADPFLDDGFDPFVDHEFDLQLDELDLDLSDIEDEARAENPKPQAVSAPVTAPLAATRSTEPDWMDDLLREATAPVAPLANNMQAASAEQRGETYTGERAPTVFQTPIATAATGQLAGGLAATAAIGAASPSAPAGLQSPQMQAAPINAPGEPSFGFDPTEISEQDEMVESFSGMDVPEVPVPEPKQSAPVSNDYDFDLDAELATLFNEPVVAEPSVAPLAAAATVTPLAVNAAKPHAAPKIDDFDAFEKALEDDLKSSMSFAKEDSGLRRGHIAITSDGSAARARKIKTGLLATAAAVVVVVAAGGVYAWLTGSTAPGGSGEPIVIAADKDPIKIVPDDPGGKAVPNQDKAVYDRVAGAPIEDPQQENLISSNEEPIDVVQRTLIPETVPLAENDEAILRSTPVGDTEDPRLLPGVGDPTANAAEEDVTIAPRRVRTMIVRPDGTLVAQEVPAEAPAQAAPSEPATNVLAAPSLPSPEDSAAARAAVLAEVTEGEATPNAVAPTSSNNGATPIPTTRPADQPVNVVGTVTDQGNLRPSQQPVETAAAAPAQAAAQVSNPGGFVIQIASLPSEADAQRSYQSLSSRYASIIGGRGVDFQRAEIAGKGTYFRVRIPAGTREQAVALCEQYRSAGGSCIVAR